MIADQTRFILAAKHRRVGGNAIIAETVADSSSRCGFVLARQISGAVLPAFELELEFTIFVITIS